MTDIPQAAAICEHYWASHVYDGLSVRLCQLCHEPDWDDLRGQLAEAAAAERERIAALADLNAYHSFADLLRKEATDAT